MNPKNWRVYRESATRAKAETPAPPMPMKCTRVDAPAVSLLGAKDLGVRVQGLGFWVRV